MAFGMVVQLNVKPGHMQQVLELFDPLMARAHDEDGCTAFAVHTSLDEPDLIWLYEAYVSEQYHDEVHETYPEVRHLLAELPQHLTRPWVIFRGQQELGLQTPLGP